jgi:hypothetical protein
MPAAITIAPRAHASTFGLVLLNPSESAILLTSHTETGSYAGRRPADIDLIQTRPVSRREQKHRKKKTHWWSSKATERSCRGCLLPVIPVLVVMFAVLVMAG